MKRNRIMILMVIIILCLSGCGRESTQEQWMPKASKEKKEDEESVRDSENTSVDAQISNEEEGSFVLYHQDVIKTILFKDCEIEYQKKGTTVYSKCISDEICSSEEENFPFFQYVLYIRTPYDRGWLFPIKDFRICEETDTLYLIKETREFEALQKIDLQKEDHELSVEELEDRFSMEQTIAEAHEDLEESEIDIHAGLHFEFEGTYHEDRFKTFQAEAQNHKCKEVKGYASGKSSINKQYYIDYERDEVTGEKVARPCVLQYYDREKDMEVFDKCQQAFEEIMQGSWSPVTPMEGMDDMWGMKGAEWRQADVNGDGMPELISQNGSGDRTEHKKPIDLIFAWNGETVDLIYVDLIDPLEFLFLTDAGQLMYERSTSGEPKQSSFTIFLFDEKWNMTFQESVQVFYLWSDEEADKAEQASYYLTKNYGKGLYFLYQYGEGKWKGRQIGYYEFLERYQNMTDRNFLDDNANWWLEEIEQEFTGEDLFDYEIRKDDQGREYAVIKGFREEYRQDFAKPMRHLFVNQQVVCFPRQLEGVEVKEFAPHAFENIKLNEKSDSLLLNSGITLVGEQCFANCGFIDVAFEKSKEGEKSGEILTIEDGAFAGNPEMWGVSAGDRKISFGSGVFEGCAPDLYLCYIPGEEEQSANMKAYARENHINSVEIPACYIETPIVDYPETPFVLTPEVRNFFYGENDLWEEHDFFEYADEAPDYGFLDWHVPCGEFCAMSEGKYKITASSELSSSDGRYAPEHMASYYGREYAWAEGVEGNGIGESISITESCSYLYQKDLYAEGNVGFWDRESTPDIYDGYMRYTEICVVNGYAKNQKVWEENGRVKRILMYVEDKPFAYLDLEDTIYPQYFTLPVDAIKAADGVDIHFRFVIEDVYPGTKYEDTCLTGLVVEFMGRHGH